jgi:hypothetical protein
MRGVCVQSMHQSWSLENDPNPRVAMTVDPPLVTLGQTKPTLQIKIVFDLRKLASTNEKSGKEADHHRGHMLANRIPSPLELIDQLFEPLPAIRAIRPSGFKSLGHFVNVFYVFSDRLLLGANFGQAAVDAGGESAELLFCKPPFFSSKFRWIESRISCNASAIRNPGGWSGPP